MSSRLTAMAVGVGAFLSACSPVQTEGTVSRVGSSRVCVETANDDVCFDPAEVNGSDDLEVGACVILVRQAESGRVKEVTRCPE